MLLILQTGMTGVFVSMDMFLFYVFWEVMLLPMYFLIGVWGGPRREYAAIKFFLYTLVGSVLMLIAILMLYFSSDLRSPNLTDETLIAAHAMAGRIDAAKDACALYLRLHPTARISSIKDRMLCARTEDIEKYATAFRLAGLPD